MNLPIELLGSTADGVFSRAQALDCGESDHSLGEACRRGILQHLRRGYYVSADRYRSSDVRGRHLLHARAAVAAQKHSAVALCGVSAAAMYGYDLYGHDLTMVHLARLDAGAPRTAASANHHLIAPEARSSVRELDGFLVIDPARAVWEVAYRSSLESGVVTTDSALRTTTGMAEELAALAPQFRDAPGSRRARKTIEIANPLSASPGESITRVQFYRFQIPIPQLQVRIENSAGRLLGISDFWWEEFRHVGEFDGQVKYQKFLRPGETPSDAVFREKKREDELRADGRGVSRFVWSMIMPDSARRTMMELRVALERSQRLYVPGWRAGA